MNEINQHELFRFTLTFIVHNNSKVSMRLLSILYKKDKSNFFFHISKVSNFKMLSNSTNDECGFHTYKRSKSYKSILYSQAGVKTTE